jgi:outer membrane protein assembly factor BamB
MLLWCNALSERQGLTPCYTVDEGRRDVLRQAWRFRVSMWQGGKASYPPPSVAGRAVSVRWHADGYRLPTATEWQVMYRDGSSEEELVSPGKQDALAQGWLADNSQGQTHPVGQRAPNRLGLCDLEGNVAERVWDWPGIDYYRAKNPKGGDKPSMFGKLVFGSCFASRDSTPITRPLSELPSVPRPVFGFRVVRCEAGAHPERETLNLPAVLALDTSRFDPLVGRVARGNLMRDGSFAVKAVPSLDRVRWEFKAGGAVRSGIVVVDGLAVFGGEDGLVYAVGADDGRLRWSYATKGAIRASVAVVDGVVYATSHDKTIIALRVEDGSLRWRHTGRSPGMTAPAVAYGVVFAGFGYGWSGELVGLAVADGREVWRYRLDPVNGLPNGMALDGERLVTPVDDISVVGIDLRTEYCLWKNPGIPTRSTVPIADGRCFYAGEDRVSAQDLRTGERLWTWFAKGKPLRTTSEREPTSSPATMDGVLYQGWVNGTVCALSAADGAERWVVPTGAPVMASPAVGGGRVYLANDDGIVLALEAATGAEKGRHTLPAPSRAAPWLAEGVLFVASDDGTVRALE